MELTLEALLKIPIKDEVIIFQTDTVYGVGCLLNSQKGIEKIYGIKERDRDKPLAVLVGNIEDAKQLTPDFNRLEPYANRYWPGALTLVIKKTPRVPDYVTRGLDSVGIRCPDDQVAQAILKQFGPMAVTSLNLSNEPPVLKYKDALSFSEKVDIIVTGPDLNGISSTVFDLDKQMILRQGSVKVSE